MNWHGSTKLTGASKPFSLTPTGTLSRRHLAHFVSAIDSDLFICSASGLSMFLMPWMGSTGFAFSGAAREGQERQFSFGYAALHALKSMGFNLDRAKHCNPHRSNFSASGSA